MNKELSLILLDRISSAPYLDRVSGMVQTFTQTSEGDGGRIVTKKIPVTPFATFQECVDNPQGQIAMIPNSRYKSLLYFEDGGVSVPTSNPRTGFDYTAKLRLVCWLNTNLISGQTDMMLTAKIMGDIIGRLVVPNPFNASPFTRVRVNVSNIPAQDKGIFSKYDYNEAETQYLMAPFEYFALDLNVNFSLPTYCMNGVEVATDLDPCSILNIIQFADMIEIADTYATIKPVTNRRLIYVKHSEINNNDPSFYMYDNVTQQIIFLFTVPQ